MASEGTHTIERLRDPSIASVIFAPTQQNFTLLSSATEPAAPERIAMECLVHTGESLPREILETYKMATLWAHFSQYLREHMTTSSTTKTLVLPSEGAQLPIEEVSARTFPFASHIDLLSKPIEGLLFDADDFDEH